MVLANLADSPDCKYAVWETCLMEYRHVSRMDCGYSNPVKETQRPASRPGHRLVAAWNVFKIEGKYLRNRIGAYGIGGVYKVV